MSRPFVTQTRQLVEPLFSSSDPLAAGDSYVFPTRNVSGFGKVSFLAITTSLFEILVEESVSLDGPFTLTNTLSSTIDIATGYRVVVMSVTPTGTLMRATLHNMGGAEDFLEFEGSGLPVSGSSGSTGAQGAQGAQGATGAQGSVGAQGSGAQGAQGATGAQGVAGAQGSVGAQGSGAQGAQGATGAQGVAGAQGSVGAQGSTGSAAASSPPASIMFGSGNDGSLTLVANTTMTDNQNCKHYVNVTLAGFTLGCHSSDIYVILFISGTLSLGGGTIGTVSDLFSTAGTGGAGQVSGGSSSGPGGAGGNARASVFVFAHTITGTGEITASGVSGVPGTNGVGPGVSFAGGGAGGAVTNGSSGSVPTVVALGTAYNSVGNLPNGGQNYTTGGTGGTGGSYQLTRKTPGYDYLKFIFGATSRDSDGTSAVPNDTRENYGMAGGGGAGGGMDFDGPGRNCGGGGGGGGSSLLGAGADGQTSPQGVQARGSGGGGGGGGAGASVCVVVTTSAPATLTVSASGGNGGVGGTGSGENPSDGGYGGGGAGGVSVLWCQSGSGASCVAAAGAGGSPAQGAAIIAV